MFTLLENEMKWQNIKNEEDKNLQVNMSKYDGDIIYKKDACKMTPISAWGPFFDELCKLIGYEFNSFLLNSYPDGSYYSSPHSMNSEGWVNKITPFAVLVLTKG